MFIMFISLLLPTGFSIEGPSQAKIDCQDNGDGSANITYYPTEAGEYAVHILCEEEDIHNSPFMADVKPALEDCDPSKVMKEIVAEICRHYEVKLNLVNRVLVSS